MCDLYEINNPMKPEGLAIYLLDTTEEAVGRVHACILQA